MKWLILILLVGILLAILVPVIRLGFAALGTEGDRAAANEVLHHVAGLLGGQFRARREYPWYRRPAQYGAVQGDLGDLTYELYILPLNTENAGGLAMLTVHSRTARSLPDGRPGMVTFGPEQEWHWPDRGDPAVLASYVRRTLAALDQGP